jgi:ribose 5-phosphate isomerase
MPNADLLEQMRQKVESVERANAAAEQRAARLDAMGAQLKSVEATATSPDRSITVVAGVGGGVTAIRFTEDAKRMSATQLSQTVMDTLRQAVAAAARQQAEVVQAAIGDDIDVLDRVLKTQEQIFGQAPESTEPDNGYRRGDSW